MAEQGKLTKAKKINNPLTLSADLVGYLDLLQERVVVTDLESNFVFLNKAAQQDLGKQTEVISPLNWHQHYQVRDANTLKPLPPHKLPIAKVLATGKECKIAICLKFNQTDTYINVHARPHKDANGTMVGCIATYSDITLEITQKRKIEENESQLRTLMERERHQANRQLKQSEASYKSLVEHMNEGVVLLDDQGNISFANERFCKLIGYNHQAVIGSNYATLLQVSQPFSKPGEAELRIRHKKGDERWHYISITKYQASKNQPAGLMLIHSDMTAEKKLAEERERLLITVESTTDFVAMIRIDGTVLYANAAVRKAVSASLSMAAEKLVVSRYYTTESLNKLYTVAVPHAIKYGTWQGEMNVMKKGGKIIPISQLIITKRNADGKVEYFASIGRDISESKKLDRKMAILARMPHEQPSPLMRISRNGVVKYANPASGILLEHWATEIGKKLPLPWQKIVTSILKQGLYQEFELTCGKVTFELKLVPVPEYDYVNLIGLDISHRKRVEQELKTQELYLRQIIDSIPNLVFVRDGEGHYKLINKAFADFIGKDVRHIAGRKHNEVVKNIPLGKQYILQDQNVIATNEEHFFPEQRIISPIDNKEYWFSTIKKPLPAPDGKIQVLAISTDITQRKLVEQSLKLQLRLKEMISNIATRFINTPYHQIDAAIDESIKILGELNNVDRVVINLKGNQGFKPRYYWLRNDNAKHRAVMKLIHPYNNNTWEAEQIKEYGYLYMQNTEQIPKGTYLKEFVEMASIKSSIVLPLQSKGELIGLMSLTSTQNELTWSEDIIALLRITAQVISSALERKTTEALLNFTLQFENIITIISANFINIAPKDINAEITASLRYVAEFLGVDQSYIFMANSTGRRFKLSHHWLDNNLTPNPEMVSLVEAKKFVWVYRQVKKHGLVSIESIDKMPEEAVELQELFTKNGIKSMIGVPIMSKNEFRGLLIIASFKLERFWHAEAVPLLKIFGQIVANALERRKQEEEIGETRELYRTLARNIPKSAVFLYDRDLRYRLVEGAELENQGYDKDSMEGRTINQTLPPATLKLLEPLYRGALNGKEHIMEREFNKKHYLINFLPVRNERNEIYAGMVMSLDISDLKEIQRKLEEHTVELTRSNEDLEQFAYAASHDLQEPLRMVSSYVHLIERRLKDQLDADTAEFMHYAIDGVKRMQELINALLEYSRVDRKGNTFRTISMNKTVEFVKINLQRAIAETQAVITSDPLPDVVGDQPQIISLFQNLLENAIKFHGLETPRVHIGYKQETDRYTFFVKDNGIGIDKKYFERIFIIFQRLNSRSEYAGTGIGLAICKKIVERHGGKLSVDSEPGNGTTFYFDIEKPQA